MEIRVHGRGGQGGVTGAKILAAVYAQLGKSVQTFGDYSGERSGAPVRAYTRVSDEPITNRNKVYRPDHLLVLDPTLLDDSTVLGLGAGGLLVLNTPEPPESFNGRFNAFRFAAIDATKIAREHGIGTRSLVIVNTTIAGAYVRACGLDLETLKSAYTDLGLSGNFDAARDAFETVHVIEPDGSEPQAPAPTPAPAAILPLTEHLESPPTGLQTGSWRTQMPIYKDDLAPCTAWCPAGNDVVGFIQAAAGGDDAAAAEILGRTTPLSAVCGRVCPAPCMEGCNRADYDGTLNIRGLERWVADKVPVAKKQAADCADPKRIAIIGGGPAGLSAAYHLAGLGHKPVIFEGEKELGGVLRTGIPVYRLPREDLDQEIQAILDLGAEARCGEFLNADRVAEIAEAYDGVIIATGLQRLRGLDAPGADLGGIEQGIRFLHRVTCGGGAELSGHVVVLGGGNTAMDCARSALRCGADSVTVAYRRTRAEMPAIREEIEEADHEGIVFAMQRQPVGFTGNGSVQTVTLAEVEMGEPDESGRRSPVVTERTDPLECDAVLLALGQSADMSLLPEGWELKGERVFAGDRALPVFGSGDIATWDGTVTHAIGDGRRVAGLLLRALGDEQADVFEMPDKAKAVPSSAIRFGHFRPAPPAEDQLEDPATRARSFGEANRGLEDGQAEASRCFSCGKCTMCDTCLVYCPEGIIWRNETGYDVDLSFCKGCGICVVECPRESMEMV